ncbi:MAG: S8/S53 family peptidase [Bacteroidetes bacterium]|nr:S8/S53 family peptidase [Bacteroidota bacterium]
MKTLINTLNSASFIKIYFLFSLLTVISFYHYSFAQTEYEHGILWVTIDDKVKTDGDSRTDQVRINRIFDRYNVYSFKQALPFTKEESLLKIYEILFNGDDTGFLQDIVDSLSGLLSKPYQSRISVPLYNPADTFWVFHSNDWMWHLKKIQADSAWDITRGDNQIKIAIINFGFDPSHPDLSTQLLNNYDPYDSTFFDPISAWRPGHATTVAGFVAGQTTDNNTLQPPGAYYCSIGYKTKLVGYQAGFSTQLLTKGLHASEVMKADILNLSCHGGCRLDTTGYERTIVKRILDNGTTIVASAGNGFCLGCYFNGIKDTLWTLCDSVPSNFQHFSPNFPFSPIYDSRIIIVSGTEKMTAYHII